MTFSYVDNTKGGYVKGLLTDVSKIVATPVHWTAPLVFETEANSIAEADKAFETVMGYEAKKKHGLAVKWELTSDKNPLK